METSRATLALVLLFGLLLASIGCGSLRVGVPVKPPAGFIFEKFSAPVETNFDATAIGSKVGTATARFIYEPILTRTSLTWGDASLQKAVDQAGITRVHYVDYEILSVLGVYVQLTTKVSGD
jgi:hypothetical protein